MAERLGPETEEVTVTVREVVAALDLQVFGGGEGALRRSIAGGYSSDLLSCAMAGAKAGQVWVTLQAHRNVVAVATLTDVACVIITEGAQPDADTVQTADRENVALLGSRQGTFAVIAGLVRLGVPA